MTINQKSFFYAIRKPLFEGRISASQVMGLSAILTAWDRVLPGRDMNQSKDLRHLAYMLATTHHETGRKMQPIRELGGSVYYRKMYDITGDRPRLARANGNTNDGDGARYCGRGFVQLTWKSNYRHAGEKLGLDLLANPDLALALQPAILILFTGMTEGWFTGKKLSDYFSASNADWFNARRIINGADRASLVADYARGYWLALQTATQQMPMDISLTQAPAPRTVLPRRRIRPSAALKRPQPPLPFHQMPMDPGR